MLRVSKMINCKRQFTHSARLLRPTIDPIPAMQVKPVKINYVRPIVFGLATSASIFFTAAFIHEKEKETFWQRLKKRSGGPKWSTIRDVITDDKLILADLWEEKKKMWLEKKQAVMEDLKKKLEQYQSVPIEIKRAFLAGAQAYLSMSEAEKTVAALIGLNLLVFGAWKVRGLQPFMTRYFMHNPGSGRSITLITSCFSHRDLIHLTFNMVGLWSFGPLIHDVLGREQFVAMYLSTGIGANVISHVTSLALRHTRPMAPSLGTSGSLYGLLTSMALIFPNSSVFIVFLPIIPIRISYAVPALMSLDVAGILLRWRKFDHFAHLGGAALGLAYMKYGPTYVWPNMLQTVRDIKRRGKGNGDGGEKPSDTLMEIPKRMKWRLFGKKVAVPEEQ